MKITPARTSVALSAGGRHDCSRGQALAEFALVLVPLMFLILGIVQMGFIFNAYVTVSNAAREGAREASIFVYDHNKTQGVNDGDRETRARDAVRTSMGLLTNPNSTVITVVYDQASAPATDDRRGWHVTVNAQYPLPILIPLIGDLLGVGSNMPIVGEVTMVIN